MNWEIDEERGYWEMRAEEEADYWAYWYARIEESFLGEE